jgi:hypothetical protein
MRKRLRGWSTSAPWKGVAVGCAVLAVIAFALGALAPWTFVKDVLADLIGGLVAGLVIFALVDLAFGFTERREKERHALKMAYAMLLVEMLENLQELERLENALRHGSLTPSDPVFAPGERVKAENWHLLAQGPLVEYLAPDLFVTVSLSYHASRQFEKHLKNAGLGLGSGNTQSWKRLCKTYLAACENARELVDNGHDELANANVAILGT